MHAGIHVPYRATKPKLAEYFDIAPIGLISTVAEPTRRTHTGAPACVYGPAGFWEGEGIELLTLAGRTLDPRHLHPLL